MKKGLTILLAAVMIVSACSALGEEMPGYLYTGPEYDYDHLTVGNMTRMTGGFTTRLFSYSTSDLDVGSLVNGYELTEWKNELGNFDIDSSVVSGLTRLDNADGSRSYVITLQDDLLYSDGSPVTAWDYAFSILLNTAPQAAEIGGQTDQFPALAGIEAYRSGEKKNIAGLSVMNDTMFMLTVSKEYRPFYYELGIILTGPLPIAEIAPGCEVKDDGEGVYIDGPFTADLLRATLLDPENGYVTHPKVVSGPYRLLSFDGVTAEFELNEYYKGNSDGFKPSIPYLTYTLAEKDTMMDKLANGEFGLLNKVLDQDLVTAGLQLMPEGFLSMKSYARLGQSAISFCCEKEDTVGSKELRQAIASIIDKDGLVQDYTGAYGLRMDGYYGLGQWTYRVMTGTLDVTDPAVYGGNTTTNNTVRETTTTTEETRTTTTTEETRTISTTTSATTSTVTTQTRTITEEEILAWQSLSYDGIRKYDPDPEQAEKLLSDCGWGLNADGEPFRKGEDKARCREVNGEMVPLELTLLYPEGNTVAKKFDECLVKPLAEEGIVLKTVPVEWTQLLRYYYRQDERDCDMIYLATNFNLVFDPWPTFDVADADIGRTNYTGIRSPELMEAAQDMSRTEPGDDLTYMQKWIRFQELFEEELPSIPVYGNVYFDFFTACLHDYEIGNETDWGTAIVPAYMGDATEGLPEDEEPEDDGFFYFD